MYQNLTKSVQSFEKQMKGRKFDKLSSEEKKAVISLLIDSELVSPIQTVRSCWTSPISDPSCPRCGKCTNRQPASHSVLNSSCVASTRGRKSPSRVGPGEMMSFIVQLHTFLLLQFLPTHFTILPNLCPGKLSYQEPA